MDKRAPSPTLCGRSPAPATTARGGQDERRQQATGRGLHDADGDWVYQPDPTEEKWRPILSQDFQNMPKVQQGMKSRGFPGPRPSPAQELSIIHFHKMLAEYMGVGAPEPI